MKPIYDDASDLVLPHRLNFEPIIILGLTKSELLTVTVLAVTVCVPAGLLFGVTVGKWTMGMPIGFLAAFVVIVIAGVGLAKVKRQRPSGYYQQQLIIALHELGVQKTWLVRHSGLWDVRRHRRCV